MKHFNKKQFQELVKINQNEKLHINTINARDLWQYLEIKTEFAKWIKRRIDDYGFIEQKDYIIIVKNDGKSKGRPITEYHVSINMAKELGMTENNPLGKHIRKYFIKIENEYKRIKETQKDQQWIKARYDGKLKRKELTDKIQEFIDYAYLHGSKHANTYYIHITHLLNKALFGIPSLKKIDKNLRDYCDSIQLMHLTTGETIILRALTECLDNGLEYKEIYTILSKKMDSFSDLMGKIEIPSKLEEDQYKICGGKEKKEIKGGD